MKNFLKVLVGAILFILLACLCAGIILGWRIWRVQQLTRGKFEPQPSMIQLKPPATALTGKVVDYLVGTLQKIPRDQDDYVNIVVDDTVLQGETIKTGESSQTEIEFGEKILITPFANTQLGFVNTLPDEFLVSHQGGKADYTTLDTMTVRSLHTLFQIKNSTATINMENSKKLTIDVYGGETTISFVDKDNNTKTWELTSGQKAVINDANRTVTVQDAK